MLGKYASAYVYTVETMDQVIKNLDELAAFPPPPLEPGADAVALTLANLMNEPRLPVAVARQIDSALQAIVDSLASRMPFPSVTAQVARISKALERGKGASTVAAMVRELRLRFIDELNVQEFVYVSPDRAAYYKGPMLFGQEVNDRLPAAIDDIEEAGKCLALGQGTACVLHTMRVLEVGLKALASALKIPYAPSWESYLNQISANIAKKHKNKTAAWKKDEKFYRDLSGDLLIIKQVFRNPTMHVDRKYGLEEAEQIFVASKTFMTRLAEHFSQKALEKLLR